jgi:hypothetical protein
MSLRKQFPEACGFIEMLSHKHDGGQNRNPSDAAIVAFVAEKSQLKGLQLLAAKLDGLLQLAPFPTDEISDLANRWFRQGESVKGWVEHLRACLKREIEQRQGGTL